MTSIFNDDPNVPYWQSRVDIATLIDRHEHSPERACAWLNYHGATDQRVFHHATMMRGMFNLGILRARTYAWTFTPGMGDKAIVLPVFDDGRLVDLFAVARQNPDVWGCVTGFGQFIGRTRPPPLRVHKTARGWIADGCKGVLPLAKAFLPTIQSAPAIVSDDYEHAWDLAHRAFVDPAIQFGGDADLAEREAFERIAFEVQS